MNKHDKEKLMLEYNTQIKEIIKKMQSQLPELRKNYKGKKGLIDQWAGLMKEMAEFCIDTYTPGEEADTLTRMEEMINTGIDRIKQNVSPFDDADDHTVTLKEVFKQIINDPLIKGLVCLFFAILYSLFAVGKCGPTALSVVLALFFFFHAFRIKSWSVRINMRYFLGCIISPIIGIYLNSYVYAQPDTARKIWLCGLPVVCVLIYRGVKRQRKVKDL